MGDCYITRRGGGSINKTTVIITIPSGTTSIVATASSTGKKKNAFYRSKNDTWVLSGLDSDTWTILATRNNGETASITKTYARPIIDYVDMSYRIIPVFDYTGNYQVTDDDGSPIGGANTNSGPDFDHYTGLWKIKFLTSGRLTVHRILTSVDIFLVGGGASGSARHSGTGNYGSGSGSGHTKTVKNIVIDVDAPYDIVIGSGGNAVKISGSVYSKVGLQGGDTTAFGYTASRGYPGKASQDFIDVGGSGGSGGGGYPNGKGGIDGNDGGGNAKNQGKGQGSTTREFSEPSGKLYASGGSMLAKSPTIIEPNTGNGGSGTGAHGSLSQPGSSGIVVMRKHKG